jgi:hypothetical protein
MPDKATRERAKKDKREGKAPTTQASEFVREEIEHIREGKHGARSIRQAIAIGLSKARRAGVCLYPVAAQSANPNTAQLYGQALSERRRVIFRKIRQRRKIQLARLRVCHALED